MNGHVYSNQAYILIPSQPHFIYLFILYCLVVAVDISHLSSGFQSFSGVRVTWSLVLCVCFVDRCLSFCHFSFSHCVICSSLIYGFSLLHWYLHLFLYTAETVNKTNIRISCKHKLRNQQSLNKNESNIEIVDSCS